MKNIKIQNKKSASKAFTLIELLVVVLIIGILAMVAIPQYMIARDKARLSGLMVLGGNIVDALDRASLSSGVMDSTALNLIDLEFKASDGSTCNETEGFCRMTMSGKDYYVTGLLNIGNVNDSNRGLNIALFYSHTDSTFPEFYVFNGKSKGTMNGGHRYAVSCTTNMTYFEGDSFNTDRCNRIVDSFGANCVANLCSFG